MGPGESIGAVTQRRYRAPHFKLKLSYFFFRVGLCSHTFFFCKRRGGTVGVGCDRKISIAWTRVHAIVNHSTCINAHLSDGDRWILCRHVEGSIASDHRRGSPVVDHDRGLHQDAWTAVMHREVDALRGGIATHLDVSIFIGRSWCIEELMQ